MSRGLQNRQHRDNHIVECVLAGKPQSIDPIAKKNFRRDLSGILDWATPAGTLVPFRIMPKPTAEVLYIASENEESAEQMAALRVFSPARREAIEEGTAVATRDECMAFRLAWIEAIMRNPELLDAESAPGWYEVEVQHSDGRSVIAVVLVSGYCFTGVRQTLAGFFADSAALAAWLDARGLALRE